jgi:pyruvate ferredoxin oxidoreductase delta subunit
MKYLSIYESAWADGEALFHLETGKWRYQRPIIEWKSCVGCGSCEIFCPTGSISSDTGHPFVDLMYCKGCGICCEVCRSGCIKMEREKEQG